MPRRNIVRVQAVQYIVCSFESYEYQNAARADSAWRAKLGDGPRGGLGSECVNLPSTIKKIND
jgi:hypothetical protein